MTRISHDGSNRLAVVEKARRHMCRVETIGDANAMDDLLRDLVAVIDKQRGTLAGFNHWVRHAANFVEGYKMVEKETTG